MKKIPSPRELGLPEKFEKYRDAQGEAVRECVNSTKRVTAISAPTGSGKELLCVAVAKILKEPTCIVTASRGLQDQYARTYKSVGMVDLRGRNNYVCSLKDDPAFSCAEGYNARCPYRGTINCGASQAEMRAATSSLVVTNYDKWTANRKFGQGFDHIKHVIFDEGHHMPEALAKAMQVVLHHKEIEETLGVNFLGGSDIDDFKAWKTWASEAREVAEAAMVAARQKLIGVRDPKTAWIRHYVHMRNLVRRLGTVSTAGAKDWVVDQVEGGFQFDPIRPGRYAEAALLLRVPKITVVSATLTEKTLFMSGIPRTAFDFHEYDSDFDPRRGPIYYVPTMQVKGLNQDLSLLWALFDRIASKRAGSLSRNGIVHTVSHSRKDDLYERSRFFEQMIVNHKGEPPTEMVELFKSRAGQGSILVSPSVGTGYDFPDCMSPSTKILKGNLEYVESHKLSVGDTLLGYDEEIGPQGRGSNKRRWKPSTVLHNGIGVRDCYRVSLAGGKQFVCSANHPWLVYHLSRYRWVKTSELKAIRHSVMQFLDYWDTDSSWEAGYLSGIWDGEGHITQSKNVWGRGLASDNVITGMCQVQNIVLEKTLALLKLKGFSPKTYLTHHGNPNWKDKIQVSITGRRDILRFLGQIRPQRILDKLDLNKLGTAKYSVAVPVLSVDHVGKQEVSLLTTSSKTYIAEGYAAHNSECRWQFVAKVPFEPPSKILKARQHEDKEYIYHRAWQYLVQAFGRDVRSKTDWSERFIGDTQIEWMRSRYGHLASKSFHAVFKTVDVLPRPLML